MSAAKHNATISDLAADKKDWFHECMQPVPALTAG
jgi:hypothetical protein